MDDLKRTKYVEIAIRLFDEPKYRCTLAVEMKKVGKNSGRLLCRKIVMNEKFLSKCIRARRVYFRN